MRELKALPIWFLWRKEMDGDRINKVPFAAGGGATGATGGGVGIGCGAGAC